jgi:hypothetical protein
LKKLLGMPPVQPANKCAALDVDVRWLAACFNQVTSDLSMVAEWVLQAGLLQGSSTGTVTSYPEHGVCYDQCSPLGSLLNMHVVLHQAASEPLSRGVLLASHMKA